MKKISKMVKRAVTMALALSMLFQTVPARAAAKIQPVKNIRATSTANSITLSWKKVKGAKSYKVFQLKKGWSGWKVTSKGKYAKFNKNKKIYKVKKTGKKFFFRKYGNVYKTIKKTKKPKSTVYGLQSNAVYKFKIQAVAGKKASKLSKVISVRTAAPSNNTGNKAPGTNNNKSTNSKPTTPAKTNTFDEDKSGTFMRIRTNTTNFEKKACTIYYAGSKDSNGTTTTVIEFITDGGKNWIKNNYSFAIKDVTPTAYKNVFKKLGCKNSCSMSSITFKNPLKSGSKTYNIFTITIKADAGVQALKLYESSNKVIDDCAGTKPIYKCCYIFHPATDANGNYYQYDLNLYKKIRNKIEQKLWTSGMTTQDKLQAVGEYIRSTTHYPKNIIKKEYNPEFWNDWSVEGVELLRYMTNNDILDSIMAWQGGVTNCTATAIMEDVALNDLHLKTIGSTSKEEGVYIGIGSLSSNPGNPNHETFYYVDKNGTKHSYDVQGIGSGWTSNLKCSEHHCKDHLISLD